MIQELLKYQEVEAKRIAIDKELRESEERKRLVRAKNVLNDVDATLEKFDKKANELADRFKTVPNRLAKLYEELDEYKGSASASTSIDEAEYLTKKMQKVQDDVFACSNELNRIVAETKTHIQQYDAYRKKVKVAMDEYKDNREKFDALKESRRGELDEIAKELKKLEKGFGESELFEKYKKVSEKKIFPVLVPIKGATCGGCGMEVALAKMSKLTDDGVIECEECGRLLYKE